MRVRWIYWMAIASTLAAATAVRLLDPEPLARLRLVVFDTLQQLQPRAPDPARPVRIVDIDERSLAEMGPWPWRREMLADLVDKLLALGARVVAFDFVFPEPEPSPVASLPAAVRADPTLRPLLDRLGEVGSGDDRLAAAIAGRPVVLGVLGRAGSPIGEPAAPRAGFALLGTDPARYVPRFPASTANTPRLQSAASGTGALNWIPEHDQIVRKVPLAVRLGNALMPSLVAETTRLSLSAPTIVIRSSTASGDTPFVEETGITSVAIGGTRIPTDRNGQMWVSFTRHDPGRFHSAVDVLRDRIDRREIAGRVVLVGTSAPGLFDLRATPLDRAVPGVEVHAQAMEQILAGGALLRPDLSVGVEIVFAILSGGALAFLVRRGGSIWGAAMGAATLLAIFTATWWARRTHGLLVDPSYPALTLTAVYIFCTGFFYFQTTRDRNRVRRAFSHYMAPSIVEELARRPDKLQLGGENRLVTLYRSDLAGFTPLSEQMPPEQLVPLMNEYLTAMTEIIMAEGGFVDKYIGDAIDGVFGAPHDDPEHALKAVITALACRARLEEMNRAGLPALRGHTLRQRIGIHTGMGVVGNIGSSQRFNYTVMGDSANLASRLEGTNKVYGTSIIVSEATAMRAGDRIAWREIDVVRVAGRMEPIRIFEPMCLAANLADVAARTIDSYADGLERWRRRDFTGAAAAFARSAAADPPSRHFLERARALEASPPAADWEPVTTLDTK